MVQYAPYIIYCTCVVTLLIISVIVPSGPITLSLVHMHHGMHTCSHTHLKMCVYYYGCANDLQLHYTTEENCAVPTDVMTIHSPFGPWNMFIIQVASSEVHAEFVGTEACTVHVYMRKVNLRNF